MNIKQIIQKAAVAGVMLALLGVAVIPVAASALYGTFTNVEIQNTGETGLATNMNFDNISCGKVDVTTWGDGKGNVRMTLSDSRGGDTYTFLFEGKDTWDITSIDPTEYRYDLWATNTRYTFLPGSGDRVISGYWEFSN